SVLSIDGRTYDRPESRPRTQVDVVTGGFFETFRGSVRAGRLLTSADRAGRVPAAVVNESFVRRHLAGVDPLTQRMQLTGFGDSTWISIVGVVSDLGMLSRDPRDADAVYLAYAQFPQSTVAITIAGREALPAAAELRRDVAAIGPDIPVYQIDALDTVLS